MQLCESCWPLQPVERVKTDLASDSYLTAKRCGFLGVQWNVKRRLEASFPA
jgi:hypothetical protein